MRPRQTPLPALCVEPSRALHAADKLDYPCRLKDISVGGAAFVTATPATVGEKLIVYLCTSAAWKAQSCVAPTMVLP